MLTSLKTLERIGLVFLILWAIVIFCLVWALLAYVADRVWARRRRRRYSTQKL